jgi:hypothetical protein
MLPDLKLKSVIIFQENISLSINMLASMTSLEVRC